VGGEGAGGERTPTSLGGRGAEQNGWAARVPSSDFSGSYVLNLLRAPTCVCVCVCVCVCMCVCVRVALDVVRGF